MEPTNDVWGTISKGIEAVKSVAIAKEQRKAIQSTATPSGVSAWGVYNPFPGTWGAYPQGEATPLPNGAYAQLPYAYTGSILGSIPGVVWIAAAVLLVVALFRRG